MFWKNRKPREPSPVNETVLTNKAVLRNIARNVIDIYRYDIEYKNVYEARELQEIFEYIEYLETLLKDDSKVRILNTEISLNLFMYLKEKNIELYVPESIYKQIEKLSLNSQEDTKYSKIYKYEEDFI